MQDSADFSRLSVMVVDDNVHMRKFVCDILHAFGVGSVSEAVDGVDAYPLLHTHYVDVMICDWTMRTMNGIELLRRVRNEKGILNPSMGFIMITANSDENRVLEARQAGVTTFLLKPFSTASLYERFSRVVEMTANTDPDDDLERVSHAD